MAYTSHLCQSDLFRQRSEVLSRDDRVLLSHNRAKAIGLAYGISLHDILHSTQKFWDIHADPIISLDVAASTLMTIQYNLAVGILAPFAATTRPELMCLVDDLLQWNVSGLFCLTELGRGLDIFRMKTSATLLPSGDFDLHTPSPADAKFMPPTTPVKGIPCVAIVFAQLYVNGECHGPRPFLVNLNNGYDMCKGVTSKLLPPRGGSIPLNHAITSFNHVRLPSSALLGDLAKSSTIHSDFMSSIWRVPIGSLAIGSMGIPFLYTSSYIAGRYFQRRHVTGAHGKPMPIISYRTQQLPLLTAISQVFVLKALWKWAVKQFMDKNLDILARQGVVACFKAVMVQHVQFSTITLSQRLGAQGLFEYNRLSNLFIEMRGISIAEGDILGLSMRLVRDTLANKYTLPPSTHPDDPLALHEISLIKEIVNASSSSSDATLALPQFAQQHSQQLVESIGHRMAYDAAVDQGVPKNLVDMYFIHAVKTDLSWYVENGIFTRHSIARMEEATILSLLPHVDELLGEMEAEIGPYINAPITSDERWEEFSETLPVYSSPQTEVPVAQELFCSQRAKL